MVAGKGVAGSQAKAKADNLKKLAHHYHKCKVEEQELDASSNINNWGITKEQGESEVQFLR